MKYEIRNQSIGLAEAFKKEPELVPASAGRGMKPPTIITAIGLGEPEEQRTPVPFAFVDALENDGGLRGRNDLSYDLTMDRKLFVALDNLPVEDLPGLDQTLERYVPVNDPTNPRPSQDRKDRFLINAYNAGLIKPQNWREKITQPIRFAIKERRLIGI